MTRLNREVPILVAGIGPDRLISVNDHQTHRYADITLTGGVVELWEEKSSQQKKGTSKAAQLNRIRKER